MPEPVSGYEQALIIGTDSTGVRRKVLTDNIGRLITIPGALGGGATEATQLLVLATLQSILAKIDDVTVDEVPGGIKDGFNQFFTTVDKFVPGTTKLYLNGVRLREGPAYDYVEQVDHQSFIMVPAPVNTDTLLIDYRRLP